MFLGHSQISADTLLNNKNVRNNTKLLNSNNSAVVKSTNNNANNNNNNSNSNSNNNNTIANSSISLKTKEILQPIQQIRKAAEHIKNQRKELAILPNLNNNNVNNSNIKKLRDDKIDILGEYSYGGSELLRTKYIKTLEVLNDNQKDYELELKNIKELRLYVKNLEEQLNTNNINTLKDEVEDYKNKNNILKNKLENITKQLNDKISMLTIQKQDIQSHHNTNISKQHEKLSYKLTDVEFAREKLEKQYLELQSQYDINNEMLENANSVIKNFNIERNDFMSKLAQSTSQVISLGEDLTNKIEDIDNLNLKVKSLEKETVILRGELEKANKSQSTSQPSALVVNEKSNNSALDEYIALYNESQKEKEKLKLQFQKTEAQLKSDNTKLEAQLNSENRKNALALKDKEELIAELQIENSKLKESLAAAQTSQSSTARKTSEFGPFMDLKRENTELREKISNLNNDTTTLNSSRSSNHTSRGLEKQSSATTSVGSNKKK